MNKTDKETILRQDLTELVRKARKYGPNSIITKEYVYETLKHYGTKAEKEEYRALSASLLLLIHDPIQEENTKGRLSIFKESKEGKLSLYNKEGNLSLADE